MATTVSLNSSDSIRVTTYYGGVGRGRCYLFSTDDSSATLTEGELLKFISFISSLQNGETK